MDLKPFKLDIDELIDDFLGHESTNFSEFKQVWLSKKFSFLFEASPTTNQGFFIQSLYAHCIGYMVSSGPLLNRLSGLYTLYCLYETQPFKPPFKIYLSLEELKKIKSLAIDARKKGVKVAIAILKSMREKNTFLFGCVDTNEGITGRLNEMTQVQNARVEAAYKKLFADSELEQFIHMDMGAEFDFNLLKTSSSDYAKAKELAIEEARKVINCENIEHIATKKRLIGDMVEKTAADWNSQKELLYAQIGSGCPPVQTRDSDLTEEGNEGTESPDEGDDDFDKELEELLSQPID